MFSRVGRLAQQAQVEPDADKSARLRQASRLDTLTDYIRATLDDTTRLRLKLDNPLGVAEHIIDQTQSVAHEQADALTRTRERSQPSSR